MKKLIDIIREFLLKHIKNQKLRSLINALLNYEMVTYIIFGVLTSVVDYAIFSVLNVARMDTLIANLISTICAILFAYVTNKIWVFKSKTKGFGEIISEFVKFVSARITTLIMTELILLISELLYPDNITASQIAKLIGMVLTVILNYIFSKLFIFKKKKGDKNEDNR